jgi:hypothetical protein
VPEDKVMILSNYHSALTNILLVRNTARGRRMMYDWIAVAMSGHVECHGFDQAALEALIIARAWGPIGATATPFNHTCLYTPKGDLVRRVE